MKESHSICDESNSHTLDGLIRRLRAELLRFTGGGTALASIWQVFAEFDDDGSGTVDRYELAHHLKKMELGLDEHDVDIVINMMDCDHNGVSG